MATGRVLQFDQTRGYGFVAADDGGEDVFLHASVFDGDPGVLVPGMQVKFQVMAGDRGRKAFAVHLAAGEPDAQDGPAQPVPAAKQALASPVEPITPPPVAAPLAPSMPIRIMPDDEQMCDVLSPSEFRQELTELLMNTVPELTGQQILQVRQRMLECAKKHGWIDG